MANRLRGRIKSALRRAELAEAELQRRIAARLDPFYEVLTEDDLKHIINRVERGLWLENLINDYAIGGKRPYELKQFLYPDEIKPVITPAVQAPAVLPIAQPEVIQPEVIQAPIIETTVKPVTPAGLIKARFIGALAPGSLTVNDAIAGQRPLNRDETFLFEQSYFNRLRSIWPASWWTIES